jgi:hypothetical protein
MIIQFCHLSHTISPCPACAVIFVPADPFDNVPADSGHRIQANTVKILLDVLVANRMKRLHPHSFNIILELPAVHVHMTLQKLSETASKTQPIRDCKMQNGMGIFS